MNAIAEQILDDLLVELRRLDGGAGSSLSSTLKCFEASCQAARQLSEAAADHSFSEPQEEITFFKHKKPPVDARVLYYQGQLLIIQQVPRTGDQDQLAFYREQLEKIHTFRCQYRDLALYYELEYNYLDQYYFRRSTQVLQFPIDAAQMIRDHRVFAPASGVWAWFHAHRLMEGYLQEHIWMLEERLASKGATEEKEFRWTGTQAELTELLYALNELAIFNGSRHEIAKLGHYFSRIFGFNIGNIYRNHENNRLRRKSRTAFLDRARLALERRFDHDDEFAL